jgi:hypothetical protein
MMATSLHPAAPAVGTVGPRPALWSRRETYTLWNVIPFGRWIPLVANWLYDLPDQRYIEPMFPRQLLWFRVMRPLVFGTLQTMTPTPAMPW